MISNFFTFLFIWIFVFSEAQYPQEKVQLIIGTKIAEPFVTKTEEGKWSGISIDLWEEIARELDVEVSYREFNLEGLINAVAKKEVDIAVSPLTITSERESILDFTHSYYTTGLSIAVANNTGEDWMKLISNIFSLRFFRVVLGIFISLLLVGFVVWLFERKKNKAHFGDGISKGLGSSFWWAAVTMTTVGYGDKAPKTIGGRTIAIIWMFAGLIMISGFTAAIASALTVDSLDTGITSVNDLNYVRVVTVKSSSSEEYLTQNGFEFITVENIDEGFRLIKNNKVDAIVYDAPILKYFIKSKNISNEFNVLPIILDPINYAFALPSNSNLRESINLILLEKIDKAEWKKTINSYIGR